MRRSILHSILVTVILFCPSVLFAEALFLQGGDILRGQVIKEDNKNILFRSRRGVKRVPREDVLRILYSEEYLQKQYIYRGKKKVLHAHIVGEDDTHYYVRENLTSPDEEKIPKRQVDVVAAQRVDALEKYYNKKGSKKGNRFENLFGLRYGLNFLIGHAGSEANDIYRDEPPSLSAQVLTIEFFYYDTWFELEWSITTAQELLFPFNFERAEDANLTDIEDTGLETMSMMAVVYPFQGLDLPLGIGLGYSRFVADGLEMKTGAYYELETDTVDLLFSYRIKDFLRFGFVVGFPIEKRMFTEEEGAGSSGEVSDFDFVPHFKGTVEYYPVANLSLKFRYATIPVVNIDGGMDYWHHIFTFSIGYGFNLR